MAELVTPGAAMEVSFYTFFSDLASSRYRSDILSYGSSYSSAGEDGNASSRTPIGDEPRPVLPAYP